MNLYKTFIQSLYIFIEFGKPNRLRSKECNWYPPKRSGEKDISQNLIKNYLRSTMKDDRLSALSIMNIQAKVLNMIEFDDILNAFVDKKLRKECSAKPS